LSLFYLSAIVGANNRLKQLMAIGNGQVLNSDSYSESDEDDMKENLNKKARMSTGSNGGGSGGIADEDNRWDPLNKNGRMFVGARDGVKHVMGVHRRVGRPKVVGLARSDSTHGGNLARSDSTHGGGLARSDSTHGGGLARSDSTHGGGLARSDSTHGGGLARSDSTHGGGLSRSNSTHPGGLERSDSTFSHPRVGSSPSEAQAAVRSGVSSFLEQFC
jgi:hypothetical protein